MVALLVSNLTSYRRSAINAYGTPRASRAWNDWREAAKSLGETGPVKRERPASAEPPALVLMRDHFAACVGISILLSSALFLSFMVAVRGALRRRRRSH